MGGSNESDRISRIDPKNIWDREKWVGSSPPERGDPLVNKSPPTPFAHCIIDCLYNRS